MSAVKLNRRVLDLVVYPTSVIDKSPELLHKYPPIKGRTDFNDGLWIGKLDQKLADQVLEACEPPGFSRHGAKPFRQYVQLYSYCRDQEIPYGSESSWDQDGRLTQLVCLSRLVHPTSIAFKYSARIMFSSDGAVEEINPVTVCGPGSVVWLSRVQGYRNWLTDSDLPELKNLLKAYTVSNLPERFNRAIWYLESAFRTYYPDLRWVTVCTGLEALVKTSRSKVTAQFTERLPEISKSLNLEFTTIEARKAYDHRSSLVHGRGFPEPDLPGQSFPAFDNSDIYEKCESLLRLIIRKGLLDEAFRDIFKEDATINEHWPISAVIK